MGSGGARSGPGLPAALCERRKRRAPACALPLLARPVPEQIRGRGGAWWSPGFAGVSEVRGRPANGGSGLRGCVLEFRGLSALLPGPPPSSRGGSGSRRAARLLCPRRPGSCGLWTFHPSGGQRPLAVIPDSSRTLQEALSKL